MGVTNVKYNISSDAMERQMNYLEHWELAQMASPMHKWPLLVSYVCQLMISLFFQITLMMMLLGWMRVSRCKDTIRNSPFIICLIVANCIIKYLDKFVRGGNVGLVKKIFWWLPACTNELFQKWSKILPVFWEARLNMIADIAKGRVFQNGKYIWQALVKPCIH